MCFDILFGKPVLKHINSGASVQVKRNRLHPIHLKYLLVCEEEMYNAQRNGVAWSY